MTLTAGVDEVGRGPLAGPVIAVAVIIHPKQISGLRDSKKLSEKKRNELSTLIKQNAVAWAYGFASVIEIDKINILQASLLAMQRAVNNLAVRPDKVLVDGNRCPYLEMPSQAIIGGDDTVVQISAASIVAKVIRDYLMTVLDKRYPEYGFAKHKGYGTQDHMVALQKYGATPIHRRSFAPVREVL
ncbi:MAG: ribonuclease HII [Gammaproteobacteria bacterium]|jgi:ribonuclease HII|nr:ribonuclease HII [Gammaproteobacteria bacterium]